MTTRRRRSQPLPLVVALAIATLLASCSKRSPASSSPADAPGPIAPPILESLEGAPITELALGSTVVGNRLQVAFAVRNANSAKAALSLSGIESGPIVISGADVEIAPGERAILQAQFAPGQAGSATARAWFMFAGTSYVPLSLSGDGVEPACDVVPSSPLDLGRVSMGGSASADLTLSNPLAVSWPVQVLTVAGRDASAFTASVPAGDLVDLPASGQQRISIRFAPTHIGPHEAAISFGLPGTCGTRAVALIGTGMSSVVECARDFTGDTEHDCSADFGYLALHERSVPHAVVFRNLGGVDVILTPGAIQQPAGMGAPFALVRSSPLLVPAGGALVEVDLTFEPTVAGLQTGALAFSTTDPGLPTGSISLAGFGGGPALALEPEALSFPRTAVGIAKTLELRVTNSSEPGTGGPLLFGSFEKGTWVPGSPTTDSGEFAVDPLTPAQLASGIAPGESLTMTVRFTPSSPGAKTAAIALRTNLGGGTQTTVGLDGQAVPPCNLEARPTSVNFGTMDRGRERTLNLVLANTAPSPADVCFVSINAAVASPVYALPQGDIEDAALAGGESLVLPVQLLPQSSDGTFSDAITVHLSNATAPVMQIPVVGEVRAMSLFLSETDIDFNTVGTNCSSGERVVNVYGTGMAAAQVTSIALGPESSSAFTLTRMPTLPAAIAANGRIQVGITYRPTRVGEDRGSVLLAGLGYALGITLTVHGTGATDPLQTDVFALPWPAKKDVIMMVDNSTSMADKQASLAPVFQHLLDGEAGVNYRIAVLHPFDDGTTAAGQFLPRSGTGPCYTTPTSATCGPESGPSPTGPGSSFWPVFLALSRPNIRGWNSGFIRDDAGLAVMLVTDASDNDSRGMLVEFYEDFFLSIKGRRHRELFNYSGTAPTLAIAPPLSSGCSYDTNFGASNTRAAEVATATDGLLPDICDSLPASSVQAMSERVFGLPRTFHLLSPPDMTRTPEPIEVTIDGLPVPAVSSSGATQWDYDASRNAIAFQPAARPGSGSTLAITYRVDCL